MGACSAPSARGLPLRESEENAVALLIGIFPALIFYSAGIKISRFLSTFVTWKRYINQKSPNGIYGFALA